MKLGILRQFGRDDKKWFQNSWWGNILENGPLEDRDGSERIM
jgi:hypothetical protein